jgi:hypothetical protein
MTDEQEVVETTVFPPAPEAEPEEVATPTEPAPEIEPVTEPVTVADPTAAAYALVDEGWKAWQQRINPTDEQKAAAKSLFEAGVIAEKPEWVK